MASKYTIGGGQVRWRGRMWADGKEYTKSGFLTKREAEKWESSHRGTSMSPDMKMRDWLDKGARDLVMDGLSASTQRTYASNLDLRIIPALGASRLSSITAGQITRLRAAWSASGISASAVNGTLNTLARVLAHAVDDGLIPSNPMTGFKRAKATPTAQKVPALGLDEIERIAEQCDRKHPAYGDYVRLAGLTGARAGELKALLVSDVDLELGVITINKAYAAGKLQTTKTGRERQVVITDRMRPILDRLVHGRVPYEQLLRGPQGRRINHSTFRNKVDWVWLVNSMGWTGLRFHDLRGSAIVEWLRAGVPTHVVREMAGHASLKTTDIYVRLARNDLSDAAAIINGHQGPYSAPYTAP